MPFFIVGSKCIDLLNSNQRKYSTSVERALRAPASLAIQLLPQNSRAAPAKAAICTSAHEHLGYLNGNNASCYHHQATVPSLMYIQQLIRGNLGDDVMLHGVSFPGQCEALPTIQCSNTMHCCIVLLHTIQHCMALYAAFLQHTKMLQFHY